MIKQTFAKLLSAVRESLFLRLLLIFVITVVLFFFITGTGLRAIYANKVQDIDSYDFFEHHINMLIDDLGYPPDLDKARELTTSLPIALVIFDASEKQVFSSIDIGEKRLRIRQKFTDNAYAVRAGRHRGIQVTRNGYRYLLFGQDFALTQRDRTVAVITGGSLVFVLLLNYLLVRRLLRPITLLKEGAERISLGELDYRVSIKNRDELGALTSSINHMADSLNAMLEAKQQLLLAISHELRSPITRAKVQLQLMDESQSRSSLQEDVEELDLLVSELLEAERLNSQHSTLNTEPLPIARVTGEIIDQYWHDQPLIRWQSPVEKDLQSIVLLDRLRFTLLLRNLVSNALKYGERKPVDLGVEFDTHHATLFVVDHGQGISAEHLPHITEPFYRTDTARQRRTGGFGLGLYLCRLITEAHGGELTIKSVEGKGTRVTARFPRYNN